MKCNISVLLIFSSALFPISPGAAPFQNLGFEEVRTPSLTPFPGVYPGAARGAVADVLPGWQLFLGNASVTTAGINTVDPFDTSSRATLIDSAVAPPIEGRYTLSLIRGTLEQFSLNQRGDVPADARYFTFTSRNGPFAASINGIDLVNLNNSQYYLNGFFIADISGFQGQTVDLAIRTRLNLLPEFGPHDIDAISFSVPEPSTIVLALLVGVLLFTAAAIRRR